MKNKANLKSIFLDHSKMLPCKSKCYTSKQSSMSALHISFLATHVTWVCFSYWNFLYFMNKQEPSVTGGGCCRGTECPHSPRDFWPGNFSWPNGKREARTKLKMEQKRRKIRKGKVENWKWKEEKLQMRRGLFFLFFWCFTFQNHQNLFWFYQNWNFLPW